MMLETGQNKAVQYLRMSTEHQRYSLENQATAIAEYASLRGLRIVGTYADSGKSGLTLKERPAMKRLLKDAEGPERKFSTILVLDVSRWGRFQDTDQSANYEFWCRRAGVKVEYCAEAFENDGSLNASIMKHLKRAMAAEYSRELSARVKRAQLKYAAKGYSMGLRRHYGFRRMGVDHNDVEKGVLESGQRKGAVSDRIRMILGPDNEIATIRWIFDVFVNDNWTLAGIVKQLNKEAGNPPKATRWTPERVRRILTDELAIGNYVYNRTSGTLRAPRWKNSEDLWVRVPILEPIISRELYDMAAITLKSRSGFTYPRSFMLDILKRLLGEKGQLNIRLIENCPYAPSVVTYRKHFGSLPNAYKAIAYEPPARTAPPLRNMTSSEMVEGLQRLHAKFGYLSSALIADDPHVPSPLSYIRQFGSLIGAYAAAGFHYTRQQLHWMTSNRSLDPNEYYRQGPEFRPNQRRHGRRVA